MVRRAQGAFLTRWPRALLLLSAGRWRLAAASPLEHCSSKVNYTTPKCARTDVAACWTSTQGVDWYCLAAIEFEDAEGLDQACRGRPPLEPSQQALLEASMAARARVLSARGYYEGVCLLSPYGAGGSEAPSTSHLDITERVLQNDAKQTGALEQMSELVRRSGEAASARLRSALAAEEPAGTTETVVAPDPLAHGGSDGLVPLSWDDAYEKARETLARMNNTERHSLLKGIGYDRKDWWAVKKWYYVGNSPAMPHLGIPSLNMQDGGGGFHSKFQEARGTVTCWPSLLSLAATWDPAMSRSYAAAVGEEFAGKGANGILGPSIDVHRVARNGRNFEYLSGEDPYLGSRMAEAYVAGVQSKGVFAVIKHWIFNTQENNRENSSSVVDERSAYELYYPPFEAAIKAGASAVMCSYNRINGTFSCENEDTLTGVLRGKMGFQGFVQSDWWAVHSLSSLAQGLDQEQPGEGTHVYFRNGSIASAKMPNHVDTAVLRILAVIYRMRLSETSKCTPPNCTKWHVANVSSSAHVALAEKIATESIVMLKNEVNTLPFRLPHFGGPASIAVIGSAAAARPFDPEHVGQGQDDWAKGDYYSGGGSGHVVAGRVVTPLDGIVRRAEAVGVKVYASPTNNVQEAVAVSQPADVLIVIVATTSGESRDRRSLHLDHDADELITTLSLVHSNKRIIVLMQVPGAVVMPWRDDVDCILAMFLGGQETGGAWAAVLFGEHSPSGRLPLTMPATDGDEVPPVSDDRDAVFSEALATGYRSTKLKVAFPFGHGLSYSTFSYGGLSEVPCDEFPTTRQSEALLCLRVRVTNSGGAPAKTVAQLYLGFPPEAGYPRALLKGFVKTPPMEPGEAKAIVFALTGRDFSYYSVGRGWLTPEYVTASVGESSADLRQNLTVAKVPTVPTPPPTAPPETSTTTATTATVTTTSAATTTMTSTSSLTVTTMTVSTSTTTASSGSQTTSTSATSMTTATRDPAVNSVVIMSKRFSLPDLSKVAVPDVGKFAKETWNNSHVGEQLGSWELQLGETWNNSHVGKQLGSWEHKLGETWNKQHFGEQLDSWNDSSRMLIQSLPRPEGVRSGRSLRSIGLFLASAGLAAATLFVLSTRCACHRHRSGAHAEEEFVQMEFVADDVADDVRDGAPEVPEDPAAGIPLVRLPDPGAPLTELSF